MTITYTWDTWWTDFIYELQFLALLLALMAVILLVIGIFAGLVAPAVKAGIIPPSDE